MTTIACDGQKVAADGLGCCGHEQSQTDVCKLKFSGNVIYGITGVRAMFDALIMWHKTGADSKNFPPLTGTDEHVSLLVFLSDHCLRFTNECPYPDEFPYPQAFGSGPEYATAAMALGATAREAVEVAARFDVYTGGEITEMTLPVNVATEAAE
jgi:ATP-dependent protease HslVU (ClpYQ) peptidase subunit